MAAPTTTGFLAGLGPRARERPAPRLAIVLAAAGCALAILGALTVGGDGLGDGGGSKIPGVLLAAGVVVVGFVLLARFRSGPLATAGAVAAAFGVPPLLFFLTFDENGFPPYSTEAILYGSTLVWGVSYVVGPGRSRPIFLGAAATGLWLSALQVTEEVFDAPFAFVNPFGVGFDDSGFGDTGFDGGFAPAAPDPTTIGVVSLVFAAAYLFVGRRWDRSGYAGAATPLTVAGLLAVPFGLLALADDLEATGTGVLTAAVGVALAAIGSASVRRATAWIGGALVVVGVLVVIGELVDEATPGGLTLMAAGTAVVAAAEAVRRSTNEPDEVVVAVERTEF